MYADRRCHVLYPRAGNLFETVIDLSSGSLICNLALDFYCILFYLILSDCNFLR